MTEPRRPNSFQLSGDYGVEITYDETSITGDPHFSFRDGSRDVSASGNEIRREDTSVGTLVSIQLEAVPDLHTIGVTLLLPTINLDDGEAEFGTIAVETTSRTAIGGPSTITGALQTYRVYTLQGAARLLLF
jgi:hypothetical protein